MPCSRQSAPICASNIQVAALICLASDRDEKFEEFRTRTDNLAARSVAAVQVAGRWASSRMPAYYARGELAARGAVARLYGD